MVSGAVNFLSGHLSFAATLDEAMFRKLLADKISGLNVDLAKSDVERFLVDLSSIMVWSREFFSAVAQKVLINKVDSISQ
ncbi:MAG: hypothetical protein U9N63_15650 [Pseudomonadota bacterium]|nr:hypothetical protein [Pseudomonadota bacterium]